jgi:CheY-like chemotaxis protein
MKKIIIADDYQCCINLCKAIVFLKAGPGIKIDEVSTGKDLIEKTMKNNYSLILSDNTMKDDITGLEAIKEIRKYNPHVPIILITGERELKEHCKEAGVTEFLNKNHAKFTDKLGEFVEKYL